MFVVILAQSAATSRAFASRYNERSSENTDLVGWGMANIGAGLSGTFVVGGNLTKTQMVDGAGGHSQLAQITSVGDVDYSAVADSQKQLVCEGPQPEIPT